jgi:hypothetical protein
MALAPTTLRLSAALAVIGVFGCAVYWVGRAGARPRREPPIRASAGPRASGRASVEGVVLGVDGAPAGADVSLVTESGGPPVRGGPSRGRRAAVTRATSDGRFTITLVASGRYLVVARTPGRDGARDDATSWAAAEVDANADAPATAHLRLRRSGRLSGQVNLDVIGRAPRPDLTSAAVHLDPIDVGARAILLDGAPVVYADSDGRFAIPDLPPGQYRLTATLDSPWMTDRITANGRDALDLPIAIEPGASVNDAMITATDVPTRIDGRALDPAGRAASFALVFAFAADPAQRAPARRIQAVRADAAGRFSVTGLPSGDYLVAVATGAEPPTWYSATFLADLASRATRVGLPAGATRTTVIGGRPK